MLEIQLKYLNFSTKLSKAMTMKFIKQKRKKCNKTSKISSLTTINEM